YILDSHIITLYKEPILRQPNRAQYNCIHSSMRIEIEHALGMLKAHWKTLHQ
ncbi:hypothetical protein L873DRAFT_1610093, partial [Choiromyces venosus 120613-1]